MKRLALMLIGCLAPGLLCSSSAAADSLTAEALFEEGVSLSERGALRQACAKFEASETLDVAVGTLLRLADCYERTGRLASAWSRFREAASLAETQSMPERQRMATVRAEALRSRMARLTITVPAEPPSGYRLELGGSVVPPVSWGMALPVDAGKVAVEASAPGYVGFKRSLLIPTLDAANVELSVPRLEPLPTPPGSRTLPVLVRRQPVAAAPKGGASAQKRDSEDRGYASHVLGATFAAVGGAGLATGGVLAVLASRRNDHSLDYCGDNVRFCTAHGVELRREAGRLADAATVSLAAGGGLLITGFVVFTTAPRGRPNEQVSVTAVPEASTRGVTLRVKGAF